MTRGLCPTVGAVLMLVRFGTHVSVAPAKHGGSKPFYLSPSGSDANDGRSPSRPWKTFRRAFGRGGVGAGGELVLLDGTYSEATGTGNISDDGRGSAQIPSGPSRRQPTYVHARNPGMVRVAGNLRIGTKQQKYSNIIVRGITFEGRGSLYNTRYVVIKECGFHDVSNSRRAVFGIGTNDHVMGNSYNLIEDVWIWGRSRVIAIDYRSDHNVWRRVVIRGDGCSSAECAGSGNPNFGLSVYDGTHISVQNVIVMDRILDGGEAYADFGTAQHSPGLPYGRHEWLGTIALNGPDRAYYFEADHATITPAHSVRNCVGWNSAGGFSARVSGYNDVQNCTFLVRRGIGIYIDDNLSDTGATLKNHLVFGNGNKGVAAYVPYSHVNVSGTWVEGEFATRCAAGCRSIDPLQGTPPSIRYPTRIEPGSALKGAGEGGADMGANVVNAYGIDGTVWGDPGFNTLSARPLWPWPHEARLKAEMCAGVTRGFCGTLKTLTRYVWEQLGTPLPPELASADAR